MPCGLNVFMYSISRRISLADRNAAAYAHIAQQMWIRGSVTRDVDNMQPSLATHDNMLGGGYADYPRKMNQSYTASALSTGSATTTAKPSAYPTPSPDKYVLLVHFSCGATGRVTPFWIYESTAVACLAQERLKHRNAPGSVPPRLAHLHKYVAVYSPPCFVKVAVQTCTGATPQGQNDWSRAPASSPALWWTPSGQICLPTNIVLNRSVALWCSSAAHLRCASLHVNAMRLEIMLKLPEHKRRGLLTTFCGMPIPASTDVREELSFSWPESCN